MKYFVTKPCSQAIEMEGIACGYSLLMYPNESGGLWPTDSAALIQFSLIPRIIGCQSHTPFIFQSPFPHVRAGILTLQASTMLRGTAEAKDRAISRWNMRFNDRKNSHTVV